MHACLHTYVCISIVCMYIYVRMYIYVCMYVGMYVCMYVHVNIFIYIYRYTYALCFQTNSWFSPQHAGGFDMVKQTIFQHLADSIDKNPASIYKYKGPSSSINQTRYKLNDFLCRARPSASHFHKHSVAQCL